MSKLLAPKQLQFVLEADAKWNLAHGPVRSGKTMGSLFRFMIDVDECPDSQIWMIGHTSTTIYDNAIRLILEPAGAGKPDPLAVFRPFCSWLEGKRQLRYKDKVISTVGAKDGGAIGAIQGKTMSLVYCDEMTLYPDAIIDMINTRLSNPYSKGIATMNPSHPNHKLKQWIDMAKEGDPDYYELQIMLDDNPYLEDGYKARIKKSLSGVFYKRNYLGLWCLAEGAIFDFFDKNIYVRSTAPRAAEYYIVGVDYGINNAFAAVLIGVNTGRTYQGKYQMWVEGEYYWDSKSKGRQKLNSELADDLEKWLEPYGPRAIYIDPSAASFKLELQRRKMRIVDGNNDVENGIRIMTSLMSDGYVVILDKCPNLIREIEGYVWDSKSAERGEDQPIKKDDHAIDALRYALMTHKVSTYDPEAEYKRQEHYLRQKHNWGNSGFR
jgi:PBSX family phage terminase large subunit